MSELVPGYFLDPVSRKREPSVSLESLNRDTSVDWSGVIRGEGVEDRKMEGIGSASANAWRQRTPGSAYPRDSDPKISVFKVSAFTWGGQRSSFPHVEDVSVQPRHGGVSSSHI
jgi:hypothetical protein